MRKFAELQSNAGTSCTLGFDFVSDYGNLLYDGDIDFLILATENGFSPLGRALYLVSGELKIPSAEIVKLADWNRFENNAVSNVCLKTKNESSKLKGAVLAACGSSSCYHQLQRKYYGHDDDRLFEPNRDFYYNVSYEAIYYAAMECGAKKIGITHLSASGKYHYDIATCTAEALAHFHDEYPDKIDTFSFVGCCIEEKHLKYINWLNSENKNSHQKIKTTLKTLEYGELVTLF